MRRFVTTVLGILILLLTSFTLAQQTPSTSVPTLIGYSGILKDAQGGTKQGVTFAIYKQQEGGAAVWLETQNVSVDAAGHYSVLLGSTATAGLPDDLFSPQEQRWLGVQVQGQAEQPRVLLVSVPYAMKAGEADRLAGHSVSEFVTTDKLQSAVQEQLQQHDSATIPTNTATNGNVKSGRAGGKTVPTDPATNFVDNTSNQVVLVQQNGMGVALSASAPHNSAIVGVSNASPFSYVVAGVQAITSVPTGFGLYARQTSTTAAGNVPTGVFGQSDSPNGAGIRAYETYGVGAAYGVSAEAVSTGGTAIIAKESATSGSTRGLVAQVSSPSGTGALFLNTASGTITGPLLQARTNSGVQFSVDGSGNVNTVSTYQIGGSSVVSVGNPDSENLFLGAGAGASDVGQAGVYNTFAGDGAGHNNTTGVLNSFTGWTAGFYNTTGSANAFFGTEAGLFNTTGSHNAFYGNDAGFGNNTGQFNTFTGDSSGVLNHTGDNNTFVGRYAGGNNTTGSQNVYLGVAAGGPPSDFPFDNNVGSNNAAVGYQAGFSVRTGSGDTFVGSMAGFSVRTGSGNTFVGSMAGFNDVSGNNDVYIANQGPGVGTESNTIRIGDSAGQTVSYIAGIYGSTVGSGVPVYINSDGQLGTLTSSLRFKQQVQNMGDSTSALMKLRPVTFLYKAEYDKGPRTLQYGLIAEEVAEVYPDLVAYEPDGKPYTVKYQYLAPMLLNELQKQHAVVAAQQEVIQVQQKQVSAQQQQIGSLQKQNLEFQQRLSGLEVLISQQPGRN